MAQAIPSPLDCSSQCTPTGSPSTPGSPGINAFSIATGGEAMPAEGDTVTIAVDDSSLWAAEGQVVYVEGWGYLEVTDVPSATTVELENLEGYDNATAGTLLVAGAKVSPAGLRSGTNAYTTSTTGLDEMPAEGDSVTVTTSTDTSFMAVGQIVYVQFWGWLRVTATPTTTSVTLENIEDTATDAYLENAPPATVLPAGARIVPGGLQGPSGAVPSGALLAANNLNDVAVVATARANLGLGTAALLDEGVASGELAINDGPITNNQVVVGTGNGIGTSDAATVRALLDLTLGTSDTDIPPVDDAAGLTVDEIVVATAAGLKTEPAATVRTLLGVSAQDMLLYRHEEADGVDGGTFATGAWRTVPLNTEVVDTGNHGSIGSNQITLAAGTYRYEFGVLAGNVGDFQGRLWNVTDGAVIASSYGSVIAAASNIVAPGQGRFTLASSKTIRLEAWCSVGTITTGFGAAAGFGVGEVYSYITLFKE